MARVSYLLIAGLLVVSACETGGRAPTATVRDSAGIRIVETSDVARHEAPFIVGDTPTFAVGRVEGEAPYLLSRVVGAIQLSDGAILVANGGSNELRLFSPQGEFLRAEGSEGQGPGEYEYMRGLGRCRQEGYVAFDLNWQMNAYDEHGRFVDKTVLRAPDGISPYNVACDQEGRRLILGWGRTVTAGPRIGFYAARDRLVLANRDGQLLADYGERLVSERIGTARGSRPHPAGRATVFASHDGGVYVGSGERFEVERYDLKGRLQALLRGPSLALAVTDSVKRLYRDTQLDAVAPEHRPALRAELEAWQWPETLPAFTDLVVDARGVLWLRLFRVGPQEPEAWALMDPTSGYLGDITLRPRQSLLEAGGDYLLVLQHDSLDVQSVVRLPLDRGPSNDPGGAS
jgi:hypothetical protein